MEIKDDHCLYQHNLKSGIKIQVMKLPKLDTHSHTKNKSEKGDKNKNDLAISKKTKSEGISKSKNLAQSCINLNKEGNKNDKKNKMKRIDTVVKNEIKEEKEEEENKKTEDKKEGDNQQKLYDYEKNVFLPYGNDGCADPFGTERL